MKAFLIITTFLLLTLHAKAVTLLSCEGKPIPSEIEKCVVFFDEGQQDIIIQAKYKGDDDEIFLIQPVPKGTKVEQVLYPPFNNLDINTGEPILWTPAQQILKYMPLLAFMGGESVIYDDHKKHLYKAIDDKELKTKTANQLKEWFKEQKLKVTNFKPYEKLSQKGYQFVAFMLEMKNEELDSIETYLPLLKFSFPTSKPAYPADLIFSTNDEKNIDFRLFSPSLFTPDIKIEKNDLMPAKEFFTKAFACNPTQASLITIEPVTYSKYNALAYVTAAYIRLIYELPRMQDLEFSYCTRLKKKFQISQLNNELPFVQDFELMKTQTNQLKAYEEELGYKNAAKTTDWIRGSKPLIKEAIKPQKLTDLYSELLNKASLEQAGEGHCDNHESFDNKSTANMESPEDDFSDDFDCFETNYEDLELKQKRMKEHCELYFSIIKPKLCEKGLDAVYNYSYPFLRKAYINAIKRFNTSKAFDNIETTNPQNTAPFIGFSSDYFLYFNSSHLHDSDSTLLKIFTDNFKWYTSPFNGKDKPNINEAYCQLTYHFDPVVGELLLPWLKSKNKNLRLAALQAMCLASINAPNHSMMMTDYTNPDFFVEESIDRYIERIIPLLNYADPDAECRAFTFLFATLNDLFSEKELENHLYKALVACKYQDPDKYVSDAIYELIEKRENSDEQKLLREFFHEFETDIQFYTKPIILTLLIAARPNPELEIDRKEIEKVLCNNLKHYNDYTLISLPPDDNALIVKLSSMENVSEIKEFCENAKNIPSLLFYRARLSETLHEVINEKLKENDDPWLRLLKILFKPSKPYSSEDTIKICKEIKAALSDKTIKKKHFTKIKEYTSMLLSRPAHRYLLAEIDKEYSESDSNTEAEGSDQGNDRADDLFDTEYKKLFD